MTTLTFDIVIYGGYSGNGVAEALAAMRESPDLKVALVCEGKWPGGMLAQSFGSADIGNALLIGGLYQSMFVSETGEWYGVFKNYDYSPHVGQSIVMRALASYGNLRVYLLHPLESVQSHMGADGPIIDSITCSSAIGDVTFVATTMCLDASHEGDLMAIAIPEAAIDTLSGGWTVGREANAAYGERFAGFNVIPQLVQGNPYQTPGVLWPQCLPAPSIAVGSADLAIQDATYRLTLSNQVGNAKAWVPADGVAYDPSVFGFESYITPVTGTLLFAGEEPGKGTTNDNTILINTDPTLGTLGVPIHWLYPNATYANRRTIETLLMQWQQSKLFFFATDPSRAGNYQTLIQGYGTALDEFTGNDTYPVQLYFREGRRLIGQTVITQQNTQVTDPSQPRSTTSANSLSTGGYSLDCHSGQYITDGTSTTDFNREGTFTSGSDRFVDSDGYAMPYEAMLPQQAHCTNLLVTYCASVSHVAWASFRALWTPFSFGEAAGCIAGYCAVNNVKLKDVPVSVIRQKLRGYGCVVDPVRTRLKQYYVGAIRQNKGNCYICVQAGISDATAGPVGTGTNIPDGTVLWDYSNA